jgi:helicase
MQSKSIVIEQKTGDGSIDIALNTILMGKQAIIFVNTKRSAESIAEKIAQRILKENARVKTYAIDEKKLNELSSEALHVLPHPTRQCIRLAEMVKQGISFHHSGLLPNQRKLIEKYFREGIIKIIVATPTLAAGVDLPAFRVIIRDLKRYGLWGLDFIPVLEYEQQAGRAGRPSYDTFGEAICVVSNAGDKNDIVEKYIRGEPEEIVSKLAVEPIMRTYILSLIASEFVGTLGELEEFFRQTFYAQQYEDDRKLNVIIQKMIEQLEEWNFIKTEGKSHDEKHSKNDPNASMDFVSAFKQLYDKNMRITATLVGKRVSELYIDPYTAHFIIKSLEIAQSHSVNDFSLIHVICSCLELRPLLRVKNAEFDTMAAYLNANSERILTEIPDMFEEEYYEFLSSMKTTKFFMDWLEEKDEEYLMEHYDIRPGEIGAKKDIADWLLYSGEELAKLWKMHVLIKEIAKLRFRLKYGAREELIPLLQLKNIGRVRARMLFNNRIRDIADVKKIDLTTLSQLLGKQIALDIKKQVGQDLSDEKMKVRENKRKGQINLDDYGE